MKKLPIIAIIAVLLSLTIFAGCNATATVNEETAEQTQEAAEEEVQEAVEESAEEPAEEVAEETEEEESTEEAQESEWSIVIEGGSAGTQEFTSVNAAEIEMVEITATKTKKDGTEVEQNWKGVLLSDVLKYFDINEYSLVKVEAADGYSQDIDSATVNDTGTILGIILDGTQITEEDGLVQLVVKSMEAKTWIKNVAKIIVVE